MPCKTITKEYEVREDETVRELRERVRKDLEISWLLRTALLQDGRKLPDAVTLGEDTVDINKPLVYARR